MNEKKIAIYVSLFLLAAGWFSSCGGDTPSGGKEEYEIDRTFTRGPVDLRVAVGRKEITIAEHVDLLVETKARDGYVAELPKFGDKLEQFGIVDYSLDPPRLEADGAVVTRRVYELEPFLPGEYIIPPMTATFRQEGDSVLHSLQSDTLKVAVLSILPADMAELELKDIAPPESLPAGRLWIYITAAALVAGAAAALLIMRARRRRETLARALPPHEIAFMRLEKLLAEGLIDQKRYAEFTERVSDILRHYIEDRFGLKAPERTTEEFIVEAGKGLPVDPDRKGMLKDFLTHCDMVKFAAFEPGAEDVKKSFETCRDFVETTKTREEVGGEAA